MNTILKMIAVAGGFLVISNSGPVKASSQTYPSGKEFPANIGQMKLSEFVKLSAKDFSSVSGNKLNLKEKIGFSLLKKNMKKTLKKNPDQTVSNYMATADKKNNVWLFIIIGVVVIAIITVIIISSIDIGPIFTSGG